MSDSRFPFQILSSPPSFFLVIPVHVGNSIWILYQKWKYPISSLQHCMLLIFHRADGARGNQYPKDMGGLHIHQLKQFTGLVDKTIFVKAKQNNNKAME